MDNYFQLIKGLHPGVMVARELKKRKISKIKFALLVQEHPQTLGSVIKGKRRMNTGLSLKIEKALGLDEGFLMTLQVFYEIDLEKKKNSREYHPDLAKIRPVLFWDTPFDRIDWDKNKTAVVKRVFERGNEVEIMEIIRFYSMETVRSILKSFSNLTTTANLNLEKYLLAS